MLARNGPPMSPMFQGKGKLTRVSLVRFLLIASVLAFAALAAALFAPPPAEANTITDTAGIKDKTVQVKNSSSGCLTVKWSDPYSFAQVHTDECDAIDKSPDLRGQQWKAEQETDSSSPVAGNYRLKSVMNEDMCLSTFGIFNDTTANSTLQPRLSRCTDDDRTQWFKVTAEGSGTPQKYTLTFEGWNPTSNPIPGTTSTGYTGGRWHSVQLYGHSAAEGDAHFRDEPTGTYTPVARTLWTFAEVQAYAGPNARAKLVHSGDSDVYITVEYDTPGTDGNDWKLVPQMARGETTSTYTLTSDGKWNVVSHIKNYPTEVTSDGSAKELRVRFSDIGDNTQQIADAIDDESGFTVVSYSAKKTIWHWYPAMGTGVYSSVSFAGGTQPGGGAPPPDLGGGGGGQPPYQPPVLNGLVLVGNSDSSDPPPEPPVQQQPVQQQPVQVTPTVSYSDDTPAPNSSVTATLSPASGITSYQWQWSRDGSNWGTAGESGSTTTTLSLPNKPGFMFRISWVRNGATEYADSYVTITQQAMPTVSYSDDTPAPNSSVTATLSPATGITSYQWQWSTNGSNWGDAGESGNTTTTLSLPNKPDFKFRISWVRNGTTEYAASYVTITQEQANDTPTVSYSDDTPDGGSSVTATLSSTTGITSYQWQWSHSGHWWGDAGESGSTTTTLSLPNKPGFMFRLSWVRDGTTEYADSYVTVQ